MYPSICLRLCGNVIRYSYRSLSSSFNNYHSHDADSTQSHEEFDGSSTSPLDLVSDTISTTTIAQSSEGREDTASVTSETSSKSDSEREFPTEPTTCCMSGCANCVWLEYAEKLSEYFQDGGETAIAEIEEKVQDPNIKAFLLTELRMRFKK